jgi:NHL repeat
VRRLVKALSAGSTRAGADRRDFAIAISALALLLAFAAPGAQAFQTHNHLEDLGSAGTPNGFAGLAGLAVRPSGGGLYAVDAFGAPDFSGAVDRFDGAGAFQSPQITGAGTPQTALSGPADVAVDESGGGSDGNVYVTDTFNNLVDAFDNSGNLVTAFATNGQLDGSATPAATFSSPCGVAVDQTDGDLFVADSGNNRIWIFDETGAYLGSVADSSLNGPCGIALDPSGDLYVRNQNSGSVIKFTREGPTAYAYAGVIVAEQATDVAIDPANGDLFVDSARQVTEYDPAGSQVSQFGSGTLGSSGGIAVDGSSGKVYVSDGSSLHVFGPLVTRADVATGEATGIAPAGGTATLNGSVNPAGVELTECQFEYGADEGYGETIPCEESTAAIGTGTSPVPVHADLAGLAPGVHHFRLVAANVNGPSDGTDQTFVTASAPSITGALASQVTDTGARLIGYLNPNHRETAYHFEYGPTNSYGTVVPVPDGSAGSGIAETAVSETISSLTPATTYHFRLIASNASGSVDGPDRTFTTSALPAAPEGRVYEMVTPLDKNGGTQSSATVLDNDHAYFTSSIAYEPDDIAVRTVTAYLGSRSNNGWTRKSGTVAAAPIPFTGEDTTVDFNADESQAIVEGNVPALPGDQDNKVDVYTRTAAGLSLVSQGSIGGNGEANAAYTGESRDGRHILFVTTEQLEPADSGRVPTQPQLYERFNGQTRVVALDDAGNPIGTGGAVLGNGVLGQSSVGSSGSTGAVSADGSRVFFEAPCPAGQTTPVYADPACATPPPGEPTQLYVRENGQTTVNVGLPERSTPGNAPQTTTFQGATPDGSKVLFTTTAQLVDGDTDQSNDLYLYDFNSPVGHRLTRISGGESGTGSNADVTGVSPITKDARRIYFTATGVLAPGAILGKFNLYQYDGVENTIKLVTIPPTEMGSSPYDQHGLSKTFIAISLSSDGATAVFESPSRLTEYQNDGIQEIYMYRAATGQVSCVSCNPTGEPPLGPASLNLFRGALLLGTRVNGSVSDDGSTVVFQSKDALVPQDSNGKTDVYVWHEGNLSLLTLGTGVESETAATGGISEVAGITPDGKDIFFTTFDRLVSGDTDTLKDIYDARVDGGFSPQGEIPPCSGDSCQGQPLAAPEADEPGSAGLMGVGNVSVGKKCRKGTRKVKSAGKVKCVKAKHRKKHGGRSSARGATAPAGTRSGS